MNEFRFVCPHCGQRLRCDARLAGRTVNCPRCRRALVLQPDGAGRGVIPPGTDGANPAPDVARPPPKPYKEP